MLQSYFIDCSVVNSNTKNPIVMQSHLIARRSQTVSLLLTVSDQPYPKPNLKHSPGHPNNMTTTLSRALTQRQFDDFKQASA